MPPTDTNTVALVESAQRYIRRLTTAIESVPGAPAPRFTIHFDGHPGAGSGGTAGVDGDAAVRYLLRLITDRVAAGAAWLDLNRPDWVDRLDTDDLDMGDCVACVLGQVYGSYRDAQNYVEATTGTMLVPEFNQWSVAHGFQAAIVADGGAAEYRALADAWLIEIGHRRER